MTEKSDSNNISKTASIAGFLRPKTKEGRWSADIDPDGVVVLLIGMRVNKFWAIRTWGSVAIGFVKMLRELNKRPDLGLLSDKTYVGWRDTITVQYWIDVDHLNAYSRSADLSHMPVWKKFNTEMVKGGAVGIWHETYRINEGAFESIYVNMPEHGLAKATSCVPTSEVGHSAKKRMERSGEDEPVVVLG